MCAVIGAVIKNPSLKDFESLKRVFVESKIRGMHATGISFLPRWTDEIVTIKEAIPADQFVEKHMHKDNFKDFVNADGNLYMIGHCRYSTSDLEYNQPISDKSLSVAHNGVITQELPERWKELYGYDCETKNDSELLLHTIQENVSPLERWKDASLSVCVLSRNKTLQVFRNGKRPLYLTTLSNGVIITPTMEAPVNTYITFNEHVTMELQAVYIKDSVDYQNYENSSD
jgi:glutamine phosphoribosylpyrophosphate amidotransferase